MNMIKLKTLILLAIGLAGCGPGETPFGVRTPVAVAIEELAQHYINGRAIYITNPDTSDPLSQRYVLTYWFDNVFESQQKPYCEEGGRFVVEVREGVIAMVYRKPIPVFFGRSLRDYH